MLSIIIPAKEPEPYLEQLVNDIDSTLSKDWAFEILIQREEGLTNAVLQGVKKANGNPIIVMDADGSHNPRHIPEMLKNYYFKEYDIVIGIKGEDNRGFYRRLITKLFALISKKALGLEIDDLSGFILVEKSLFKVVKPSTDFKFILPLLYLNKSARVCMVKIDFKDRVIGSSKADLRQALKIFRLIFYLKMKLY